MDAPHLGGERGRGGGRGGTPHAPPPPRPIGELGTAPAAGGSELLLLLLEVLLPELFPEVLLPRSLRTAE